MKKSEREDRTEKAVQCVQQMFDGLPHGSKKLYVTHLEIVLAALREFAIQEDAPEPAKKHAKAKP